MSLAEAGKRGQGSVTPHGAAIMRLLASNRESKSDEVEIWPAQLVACHLQPSWCGSRSLSDGRPEAASGIPNLRRHMTGHGHSGVAGHGGSHLIVIVAVQVSRSDSHRTRPAEGMFMVLKDEALLLGSVLDLERASGLKCRVGS